MPANDKRGGEIPIMSEETVYDRIREYVDSNGTMSDKEYRTLMSLAIADLGDRVMALKDVPKRVECLESHSILLLAVKHKKTTTIITIIAVVFTLATMSHIGLLNWLFAYLDIPPFP